MALKKVIVAENIDVDSEINMLKMFALKVKQKLIVEGGVILKKCFLCWQFFFSGWWGGGGGGISMKFSSGVDSVLPLLSHRNCSVVSLFVEIMFPLQDTSLASVSETASPFRLNSSRYILTALVNC